MASFEPMSRPTLYVLSGLPGAGKSTLGKLLSERLGACYLRIDTIEQALRDLCGLEVEGEGYRLAYRVAADNLRIGNSVVADSCNPIELTRREWNNVARNLDLPCVDIEVICSDEDEHRARVEKRHNEVEGLQLPTWEQVGRREYHPWTRDRLVIDTAGRSSADCINELVARLSVKS